MPRYGFSLLNRCSTVSPAAASDRPKVFSVRERMIVPVARSRRRGATWCSHMCSISEGTPGIVTMVRPPFSAHQPGAVPIGLRSTAADAIRSACWMFPAGIGPALRERKLASSSASSSWSISTSSPSTSAMAWRVISSLVGPSPPVTKMISERPKPRSRDSVSSAISSPTMLIACRSTPSAGSRLAMCAEFVSTISPIRISVPNARISARIRGPFPSSCHGVYGAPRR